MTGPRSNTSPSAATAVNARSSPNARRAGNGRIDRDVNQEARDDTQALMETDAYKQSRSQRKKIEALFGEAKNILSMVRLRLRGLSGARDAFLLTATVQNLKWLAAHTARPPPRPMMA